MEIILETRREKGFSLIEVILAIGVFAMTILGVLAMLGSTSKATSEVLNTSTASQVADAIRSELQRVDFENDLVTVTNSGTVTLYGTKDGNRVVLDSDAWRSPTDDPPGIYERDRFFIITVDQLEDELKYDTDNAFLALSVRLEWPYQIPLGPPNPTHVNGGESMETDQSRRSISIFNISIPRTF